MKTDIRRRADYKGRKNYIFRADLDVKQFFQEELAPNLEIADFVNNLVRTTEQYKRWRKEQDEH